MSLSSKSFSLFKRDVFLFGGNLVTGVIVARILGPEALGLWAILQLIPSYAESFGRMKFDIAAVYFIGKKKYSEEDVAFTLNVLAIATSFILITLILWQSDWLYRTLFAKTTADVRFMMYLVLPQIPLQFIYVNYSYLFIQREDIQTYNRMVVMQTLFSSVGSIVLVAGFKLGLLAVIISANLSLLISVVYGVYTFGPVKIGRWFNWPLIKDLFSYAYKLYLVGIISHINVYFTNLIVALHLLPAQLAFYSMAQSRAQLLEKVPNSLNAMLFPRISKIDDPNESAELSAKAFRTSLTILVFTSIFAFVLIEPLVILLYGSAYKPMVSIFRIILPGVVLSSSSTTLNQYFQGIGRADVLAKMAVFPMFAQIGAALVLIPKFGSKGAAIAFSASLLVNALVQIFYFVRASKLSFNKHLSIRREDILLVRKFIAANLARYVPARLKKLLGISPVSYEGIS